MKIAVIGAKGLPPRQGGIEHYCAEVYPRMVAQGHQVDVFARASYTELPAFYSHDHQGIQVISLPCPGLRGLDALSSAALGAFMAGRHQYDIVHFHALGPSLFTGLTKLLNPRTKIVVTCHGLDWQRGKWGRLSSRMIFWGERAAARFADGIVVVSEDLKKYFLDTYDREVTYIPNAPAKYADSDPDFRFGQSLDLTAGRYLVYLGRLVPEKCPDLLIQAFRRILPKGWKLVFVGGASDTQDFFDTLQELAGDCPDIMFLGELRGARLAEVVRGAGLFVLPSNLEGLPLAMLEGMSEAVPIVASDIPPHQQLLGHDRGVLFESNNLEDFTTKLDWAIHQPEAMALMAKNAQQHVRDYYTWERITTDNLAFYSAILSTPVKVPVGAQYYPVRTPIDQLGLTIHLRDKH